MPSPSVLSHSVASPSVPFYEANGLDPGKLGAERETTGSSEQLNRTHCANLYLGNLRVSQDIPS
jgi:hypothetical protein